MKAFKRILVLAVLLFPFVTAGAQNLSDLRLSEVLVENTSGLVDDFGERNGWIEIFNTSNGTVKFAGCYLTDDKSNLTKYHIPSTDATTSVAPRQSVVFYASGKAFQGTYHTSFKLSKGSTLYLVSTDGRTILDSIEIPADLPADHSVIRVPVGVKMMDYETKITDKPSAGSYNGDVDALTNSQIMKEKDPHGWVLTLISVMVVFCALIILSYVFRWIGTASQRADKPKAERKPKASRKAAGQMTPEVAAAISLALSQEFGGEVYAAIAMALDDYLGNGVHDAESFIITIKPSPASNWNNKTQTFRKYPK